MSDFTQVFRDQFNGTSPERNVWNTLCSGNRSWRNQVADDQITQEDVADRLQTGLSQWEFWH